MVSEGDLLVETKNGSTRDAAIGGGDESSGREK